MQSMSSVMSRIARAIWQPFCRTGFRGEGVILLEGHPTGCRQDLMGEADGETAEAPERAVVRRSRRRMGEPRGWPAVESRVRRTSQEP